MVDKSSGQRKDAFTLCHELVEKGVTKDFHVARAMIEYGLTDPNEVQPDQRSAAKLLNFFNTYNQRETDLEHFKSTRRIREL